jgi:hypothetical protein
MYDALAIVRPYTVVRSHRAGFSLYWRWKSRRCCGRPMVSSESRRLIRETSIVNPLWGAPRIHGELLKLGIDVGQSSGKRWFCRRRKRKPQDGVDHIDEKHHRPGAARARQAAYRSAVPSRSQQFGSPLADSKTDWSRFPAASRQWCWRASRAQVGPQPLTFLTHPPQSASVADRHSIEVQA